MHWINSAKRGLRQRHVPRKPCNRPVWKTSPQRQEWHHVQKGQSKAKIKSERASERKACQQCHKKDTTDNQAPCWQFQAPCWQAHKKGNIKLSTTNPEILHACCFSQQPVHCYCSWGLQWRIPRQSQQQQMHISIGLLAVNDVVH